MTPPATPPPTARGRSAIARPAGLVLAAGAGRRMGRPKALIVGSDGVPWLVRAAAYLRDAGAAPVAVALGAASDEAAALAPEWVTPIVVGAWREGVGATLRESLTALGSLTPARGVLVTLVDLPSADVRAAERVVGAGLHEQTLRRATYDGRPGHPVLIGRAHWPPLVAHLEGDIGAQAYLTSHGVESVECGDLGGGEDVDRWPAP